MHDVLVPHIQEIEIFDLDLPEYAPQFQFLPAPLIEVGQAIDCPICNKDGEGVGEIVRFEGREGHYFVHRSICPVCNGRCKVVPTPESNGLEKMDAAGRTLCLECHNTRKVLLPPWRSPSEEAETIPCPVCSVPTIVF